MNSLIRQLLAGLVLWCGMKLACAQPALKCAVCGEPITGQYHLFDSPALPEKKAVCQNCLQIETTCFICSLPVKSHYQTLEDGRFLCERDSKAAVLTQVEAERIWEETRRDVGKYFVGFGDLPRNFAVGLVDQTQMAQVYKSQISWHDKSTTLGLTRTRRRQGQIEHSISLLSGLHPARMAAVCAHEYAHAWMHENVPRDRNLEGNTVEGFCELVAYKLMLDRNESVEKKVILANTYTRGQIHSLIQAEEGFRFHRVLDWLKTGVDDRFDKANLARVLALKGESTPEPLWYPRALPTPVPDTLTLKGISGKSNRRFALINDCTLEKNEEGKVRVGKTSVLVRCLEISEHSVVVQQRGSADRIELSLREME